MANTDQALHKVTVKEDGSGNPRLAFELLDGDEIPMLKNCDVGLMLNDGTTYEEAKELAAILNKKIKGMFLTNF